MSESLSKERVDNLSPHPFNDQLYSHHDLTDLKQRINEHGFKETHRITITEGRTILSGHRRWMCARELGLESVPVEIVDCPDTDEQKRRILMANEYRNKTPADQIREAEAWEELEGEKAKERQKEAGEVGGKGKENFPDPQTGQSRDKAAEKVGVSGRTFHKGKKVKQAAEQGDETAQREWQKLESGEQSIHGAYTALNTQSNKPDTEPESDDTDESPHTELKLLRTLQDGSGIYTSGGDTYIVPTDQFPDNE